MSGALQAVFQNQRSFIAPVPVIGSAYGGGFFAGQISTAGNGVADFNLVIGPKSSAQSTLKWSTRMSAVPGAGSVINGPQNTADIVADGNAAINPAANFCNDLVIGGFSDWYLPAKNELEVCYYNLKPTTTNNSTSSGTNTNAVPSRGSNYTTGTPARTSVTDFQTGNSEAFDSTSTNYWSSTEMSNTNYAWAQDFNNGYQGNGGYKTDLNRARGIRRVAV